MNASPMIHALTPTVGVDEVSVEAKSAGFGQGADVPSCPMIAPTQFGELDAVWPRLKS